MNPRISLIALTGLMLCGCATEAHKETVSQAEATPTAVQGQESDGPKTLRQARNEVEAMGLEEWEKRQAEEANQQNEKSERAEKEWNGEVAAKRKDYLARSTRPETFKRAVSKGNLTAGMTKAEVLLSMGHTPEHRTRTVFANIETEFWSYGSLSVSFENGIVRSFTEEH